MEEFQGRYGMETDWDNPKKSVLFMLGKRKPGDIMQPVSIPLPTGVVKTLLPVDSGDILQTPINDPAAQAKAVQRIVDNFTFPKPGKDLPITAIRKIAHVSLAARIRARLQYSPIAPNAVKAIHISIKILISEYYRMSFRFNHNVLFGRLQDGGLDFPNVERMNATWSVSMLHRALNSNNATTASASEIILATLQCNKNKSSRCFPPFGPLQTTPQMTRTNPIPKSNLLTWEVATRYMRDLEMEIIPARHLSREAGPKDNPSRRGGLAFHNDRADRSEVVLQKFEPKDPPEQVIGRIVKKAQKDLARNGALIYATDGSMDPAPFLNKRRTAFAIVGSALVGDRFMSRTDLSARGSYLNSNSLNRDVRLGSS
ncbi:hypothetical protein BD324DRAFT_652283 [Kockovaella imperatae]|uniref:Uncharacterized protein n=1 Tax=Kockovaella imperatae TaxID=4999 RepID=A0A1Y1UCG9_9TREE|nr:hypothetical protein BD324DRAFT_652283 [Kockovaella imperatae]ORX35740.1 hypothetical protein BD324DRAFT_652283 [Kockovaella imperatae]